MLLTLTCLFTLSAKQDLTKPVDYETRAKPTSAVLLDLSKKTGVEMFCTPDLDNEPLILKLNHVPLKNAMDKIAFVFAGEWKKHENGYQLQRSDEAEKLHQQNLQQDGEDYVAGVKQAMKTAGMDKEYSIEDAKPVINNLLRLQAQTQPDMQAWVYLNDHNPSERLLLRILAELDPKEVVDLPQMPRVFSDKPTALEKQLPDIADAIRKFDQEQQVLDDTIDHMPNLTKEQSDALHVVLASRSSGDVDRIVIALEGGRGRYSAGIWIADATGKLIMNGGVDINGRADESANIQALTKIAHSKTHEVPLGNIAQQILPNINNPENFHRLPDEVKAIILAPTKTDPLAIATSDVVLGLADADKVNVAFLPPDGADAWCYQIGRNGKVSLAALEQQAAYSKELDVSEENGWLIGAPLDPLQTAKERLSRPALEQLLNTLQIKRTTDIDALATFEADARPDSNKILASDSLMALMNGNFNEFLPEGNVGAEPSLALLGSLSDDQRSKAKSGALKVVPGELSDQQMDYLHQWLLGYGQHFQPEGPDVDMTEANKTLDGQGMPTEVMGDGPPMGSYLHVVDQILPFYDIKATADAKRGNYGSDLDGLAWNEAKLERPDIFSASDRRKLDYISIGSERVLTMRYVVKDRTERCEFIEYHEAPKDAPTMSLTEALQQLTPELRTRYNDSLAHWRARFVKQKPIPVESPTPPGS